jgi:hypothetical protein
MVCPSCGSETHSTSKSKECPYNDPRWATIPPPSDFPLRAKPKYRSFKTGLATILKDTSLHQPILENVASVTHVAYEASRLLQIHLQRLLEGGHPLPPFHNRTWLQKCFDIFTPKDITTAFLDSFHSSDPQLLASFLLYLHHRGYQHQLHNLKNVVTQIKSYLVKDYLTVLLNHIRSQFWIIAKRQLKHQFLSHGLSYQEAKFNATTIVNTAASGIQNAETEDEDSVAIFSAVEEEHTSGQAGTASPTSNKEKDTSATDDLFIANADLLMTTYKAGWEARLRFIHRGNLFVMEQGGKLSSLVPLYTPEAKYITIDTDALWGLLGCEGGTNLHKTAFGKDQLRQWCNFLKLPSSLIQTASHRRFSCMIHTDGVGCTVKIAHWVPALTEAEIQLTDAERRKQYAMRKREEELRRLQGVAVDNCSLVGVDPGRKEAITVVKEHGGGEESVFSVSNGRYYHDCKFKYRLRRMELWMRGLDVDRWWQHQPSVRYGRLNDTLAGVRYVFSGPVDRVFALRLSHKCKKTRWKAFIHQQKALCRYVREILSDLPKDKHTIVAFGDGKFNPTSKGYAATPRTKRLLELLRRAKQRASWRRYNITVIDIWEFNTSQVCSKCHCHLPVKDVKHAVQPHFVRRCQNPSCHTTWDRVSCLSENCQKEAKLTPF